MSALDRALTPFLREILERYEECCRMPPSPWLAGFEAYRKGEPYEPPEYVKDWLETHYEGFAVGWRLGWREAERFERLGAEATA